MSLIFGLYVGAWFVLWLSLFAWAKIRFPDSAAGKVAATIC